MLLMKLRYSCPAVFLVRNLERLRKVTTTLRHWVRTRNTKKKPENVTMTHILNQQPPSLGGGCVMQISRINTHI